MRASTVLMLFGLAGLGLALFLAWVNWSDYQRYLADDPGAMPFREGDFSALVWNSAILGFGSFTVIAVAFASHRKN